MWAESTGQLSWVGVGSPMTAGGGDDGHCPDFDLRIPCWIIFFVDQDAVDSIDPVLWT